MRAVQLSSIIVALVSSAAMATDGVVTWSISMPNATIDPAVSTYVDFLITVGVTGDNQGLASFQYDLALTKISGPGAGSSVVGHPTLDWGSAWNPYQAFPTEARGTIVDAATAGGPGLGSGFVSLGTTTTDGFFDDIGAGMGDLWDPFRLEGKRWIGTHQWGVGMASRKADLLVDPAGDYLVNYGYWNLTDFLAANGPGIYKIEVLPVAASVLKAELDLTFGKSDVTEPADQIIGASLTFPPIVPDPATLLLLAAATALLRRRGARKRCQDDFLGIANVDG